MRSLHAEQGDDVPGLSRISLFPGVGVHFHDPANAFGLARGRVENRVTLLQLPGVDAGEAQGAVAVVHNFEGQGPKGLLRVYRGHGSGLVSFQVHFRLGGHLRGARQVVHHSVEYVLYPFILEGGAAVGGEPV